MDFHPCIVIPIYNHPHAIASIVDWLIASALPTVIVDDGSTDETAAIVDAIADRSDLVKVLRHPANQGKGVAVHTGFQWATENDFTHAIQMDADGQHDLSALQRFLDVARASPGALVLGQAVFDESVPKARRFGRYVTHFWVYVETLSFAIKDSMCGCRVYPIAAALKVMNGTGYRRRMDFDTDIAVRLCWAGLEMKNVKIDVRYPQDNTSHFRLWRDNIAITWMHTRLVFGMICRLPILLFRRSSDRRPWHQTEERGSEWGMRLLLGIYRFLGRSICRWLVYCVVTYFFLTSRRSRQASQQYLQRLYQTPGGDVALGRPPGLRDTYRHFLEFGEATLDRFSAWLNDLGQHHIEFPGHDQFADAIGGGTGAVIIGAHLGNMEVMRAAVRVYPDIVINALFLTNNAQRYNAVLKAARTESQLNIIPVDDISVATINLLQDKINAGEVVALLSDRTTIGSPDRVSRIPFLGHEAPFPHGPFILASLLECPVFHVTCIRKGGMQYTVHMDKFADCLKLPRGQRLEALNNYIAQFARQLEQRCLLAPYQWFNFYDFWADSPKE